VTTTTKEKLTDYAIGGAAGLAGVMFGLSKGVTILLLLAGSLIAFFAPHQIRRFMRYRRRRRP
jgi:hypothetical protein